MAKSLADARFTLDARFSPEAGPSRHSAAAFASSAEDHDSDEESEAEEEDGMGSVGSTEGMDMEGFAGPTEKAVKPLSTEELAAFKAAQERTGVVYISRIPPGMRPTKVRHLMSAYGEVGRVYLQPEGAPRCLLMRNDPST